MKRKYCSIAELLQDFFTKSGDTELSFATLLGSKSSTVGAWRRGYKKPNIDHLTRIEEGCKIPLEYLLALYRGEEIEYDLDTCSGKLILKISPIKPEEDAGWINDFFIRANSCREDCKCLQGALLKKYDLNLFSNMNFRIQNARGENCGFVCSFYRDIEWKELGLSFRAITTTGFTTSENYSSAILGKILDSWQESVDYYPSTMKYIHVPMWTYSCKMTDFDQLLLSARCFSGNFDWVDSLSSLSSWGRIDDISKISLISDFYNWVKWKVTPFRDRDLKEWSKDYENKISKLTSNING